MRKGFILDTKAKERGRSLAFYLLEAIDNFPLVYR